MSYAKPMVTIELAEYMGLLTKASRIDESHIVALKMLVAGLLNNPGRPQEVINELQNMGVIVDIPHTYLRSGQYEPSDINLTVVAK